MVSLLLWMLVLQTAKLILYNHDMLISAPEHPTAHMRQRETR